MKLTKFPEFENVTVNIQFYNMPLGEISDNIKDKIKDAKDFSFLLGDWVGTMQNILGYGEKICKLINTIMKIYGAVGAVAWALSGKEVIPILGEAVTTPRQAVQTAQSGMGALSKEGWQKYVNQFCKFFSCRLFYDEMWGIGNTPIGQSLGKWQHTVLNTADWIAVGGFLKGGGGGKSSSGENSATNQPTIESIPIGEEKVDIKVIDPENIDIPTAEVVATITGADGATPPPEEARLPQPEEARLDPSAAPSGSSGVSHGLLESIGIGGEYGVHAWANSRTGYETVIKDGGVLNPKDSIVISTLTLCIPGIIYNLNKLRQIQCMYIDCMQNYVQQGLPLKACEDQKHYATCKYWWGEIFQLLPFTGLLNFFTGMIKNVLSSPLNIVDAVMGLACMPSIKVPKGGVFASGCLANDIAGLIFDIWSDLEGMFTKDYWKFKGGDYCSRIDDVSSKKDSKEKEK